MKVQGNPKRSQRSWTQAEPDVGTAKWKAIYILSTLLACAVGGAIWWLFYSPATSITIFASLVVEGYKGNVLPNPAYASWDVRPALEKLGKGKKGNPEVIPPRTLEGAPAIEEAIVSLNNALSERDQRKQDTVVIYLRGHAIAENQEVYLLAGEFDPGNSFAATAAGTSAIKNSAGKISMREILKRLQSLRAANVVVLADLCDLTSVPQFGLVVNPVANVLQRVCEELPKDSSKRLWVICAAANLQPAHVSHHFDRTLFQSACDFACRPTSDSRNRESSKPDGRISLGEFYEQVLRFCFTATTTDAASGEVGNANAVQTPLLFRAGADGYCLQASAVWKEAERVQLLVVRTDVSSPAKTATERDDKKPAASESKSESKSALRSGQLPPLRWVAYKIEQASGNPTSGAPSATPTPSPTSAAGGSAGSANAPATSSAPASNSSAVGASPAVNQPPSTPAPVAATQIPLASVAPTPEEARATNMWLRFWQLRDAFASRRGPAGWSPADFSPHLWRQLQSEVVRDERLERANATASGQAEIDRIVAKLEELHAAMQSNRDVRATAEFSGTVDRLCFAWNRFRQTPWLEKKNQWENDQHWSPSDLLKWQETRDRYRTYIDAMSQTAAWLEWSNSLGRHAEKVSALIRALKGVSAQLPASDEETAMRKPISPEPIRLIEEANNALRLALHQEIRTVLDDQVQGRPKTISWSDEYLAEKLLDCPLLFFPQRRDLAQRLKSSDYQNVGDGTPIDKDSAVAEILEFADRNEGNQSFLSERLIWCNTGGQWLEVAGVHAAALAPLTKASVGQLNEWGFSFRKAFRPLLEIKPDRIQSDVARWRQACAADATTANHFPEVVADILVRTTDERGLFLKLAQPLIRIPQKQTFQPVDLDVYTSDGTEVRTGFISWKLTSLSVKPPNPIGIRSNGSDLQSGAWHAFRATGNQISLEVVANVDQAELDGELEIEFLVSQSDTGANARSERMRIVPPKTNHVDLYVSESRASPRSLRRAQPLRGDMKYSSTDEHLAGVNALRVPAVEGARSLFDFYAVNRFGKAKRVKARIYCVPEQTDRNEFPLEPGSVVTGSGVFPPAVRLRTLRNIQEGALKPMYESQVVELPAAPDLDRDLTWEARTNELAQFEQIGRKLIFARPAVPTGARAAGAPVNSGTTTPDALRTNNQGLLCWLEELDENEKELRPRNYWHKWIDARPANPATDGVIPIVRIEPRKPTLVDKIVGLQIEVEKSAWDRFGIEKLRVAIDLTNSQGASFKPQGLRNLELTPEKPVQSAQLKILDGDRVDSAVLAQVSIGGYPRAVIYEAEFSTERMEPLQSHFFALVNSVAAYPTGANDPALPKPLGDRRVYPNRIPVLGKTPVDVEYQSLRVDARADVPQANSSEYEVVVSLLDNSSNAIGEATYPYDRQFATELIAIEEGSLVLKATARDIAHNFTSIDFNGRIRAVVQAQSRKPQARERSESEPVEMIFDRLPPVPSKVRTERLLYIGESMELSILSRESESDVERVEFRIDKNENGVFDESDGGLDVQVRKNGDYWESSLKADKLKDEPKGEISIVARTIDLAGNEQSANDPGVFMWTNAPNPASVALSPKKKPSKSPAAPSEKLHNVRVVMLLDGVAFVNAKSFMPQGLKSKDKKVSGNIWSFSGVPSGDYTVTATATRSVGTYEGKSTVSLTDSDGDTEIKLDLKAK